MSWSIAAWIGFGLALTLGTQWLAARRHQASFLRPRSGLEVVSTVVWAAIVAASGLLAGRYIERIGQPVAGYLVFGLAMFILSLARALLLMRTRVAQPITDANPPASLDPAIHTALYLVLGAIVYFAVAAVLHRRLEIYFLLLACLGTLLPDLDNRRSVAGRLLPFISGPLESRLGHRQEWHTPAANVFVALITLPLVPLVGWIAWALISLGFLAHLTLDVLDRQGLMLFWPATRRRYFVAGTDLSPGSSAERRLLPGLLILAVALGVISVRAVRPPAPLAAPSYDDIVRRYLGLRGTVLVFADVDGTWQAAGQRVYARFEILNSLGPSFVMLDRATGAIFTAGRDAEDDLYLNAISLAPGAAIRVKPVEQHLAGQRLGELLPTIYRMQDEPGLQYIFISGDVILPAGNGQGASLAPDYAQARLRKITRQDSTHYVLRYLTAAELIALSEVEVESGDVVIVAVYSGDESAATATPLPLPSGAPATPDAAVSP
jgi:membrane-bound metal-dependent hydrolase YbcI (DUF457 family)